MPITVRHMLHVKNLLVAMQNKRESGLRVKQNQCQEETTDDVEKLLAYVTRKIREA